MKLVKLMAVLVVLLAILLNANASAQLTKWKTQNAGSVATTKDSFYVDASLRQPGVGLTIMDSRAVGATETDTLWFSNGADTSATQKVRLQPGMIANVEVEKVAFLYIWTSGGTLKYQIWVRPVYSMPVRVGN